MITSISSDSLTNIVSLSNVLFSHVLDCCFPLSQQVNFQQSQRIRLQQSALNQRKIIQ